MPTVEWSNKDIVGIFYTLSWLGHKTLFKGGLHLRRDAVGVFLAPAYLADFILRIDFANILYNDGEN